jgi:hypothetical protein
MGKGDPLRPCQFQKVVSETTVPGSAANLIGVERARHEVEIPVAGQDCAAHSVFLRILLLARVSEFAQRAMP